MSAYWCVSADASQAARTGTTDCGIFSPKRKKSRAISRGGALMRCRSGCRLLQPGDYQLEAELELASVRAAAPLRGDDLTQNRKILGSSGFQCRRDGRNFGMDRVLGRSQSVPSGGVGHFSDEGQCAAGVLDVEAGANQRL